MEGYLGGCLGDGSHQHGVLVALTQGGVVNVHGLVRLGVDPPALVVPAWDVPVAALVVLVVGASTPLTVFAHSGFEVVRVGLTVIGGVCVFPPTVHVTVLVGGCDESACDAVRCCSGRPLWSSLSTW